MDQETAGLRSFLCQYLEQRIRCWMASSPRRWSMNPFSFSPYFLPKSSQSPSHHGLETAICWMARPALIQSAWLHSSGSVNEVSLNRSGIISSPTRTPLTMSFPTFISPALRQFPLVLDYFFHPLSVLRWDV